MAYMSETGMLYTGTSIRLQSASVEQTYSELELPSSHLSLLQRIPRLPVSLSNMSQKSYNVSLGISCSTPASTSCSPVLSPANRSEFPQNTTMPRGDEFLDSGTQLRPQKWYGQCTLAIPRSISAVDLQAKPREQQQQGSRLRPSGPSVRNIREYGRVASCKEVSKDPVQRNTSQATRDNFNNFAICSDSKRMRRKLHYKSYQELHILSMYQDDSSLTSSKNTGSTFGGAGFGDHHEPSSVYSDSDTSDSGNSSPYPITPEQTEFSNQDRSIQLDIEGGRNTKRGDARRVHVIEHRQNQNYVYGTDESESVPVSIYMINGRIG